ncbi:hypothetical protein I350_02095 [Cryptococcus amylolentus CBS 6273]|uniref:Survival factor 1 n=1 Tax=Cryptococcus amylolentus CBS 6273 TaxID=1296118 RepID=A0A1E3KAK2_9TREE|nr:hypothetical protein I350_02095 [Cryptococcus amylolentus CBS 6273]
MSWFSSKPDAAAAVNNFWPATSSQTGFGELTSDDTAWLNTNDAGFQTETQTWYTVLADGSVVMVQIIWSYLGVFLIPATTQITFKHYNPATKKSIWKSVNASKSKFDRQNCKADEFEIKHTGTPATDETYSITAHLEKDVQISVQFTKPSSAPGFKLGSGPEGGVSTFGKDKLKRDGYVVHRFHPLVKSSGTLVLSGAIVDMAGEGMFVHAIQGMRPNLVASTWNFAFFTTAPGQEDEKLGAVRAIQMEFETTEDYGPKGPKSGQTKVNIGCVYSSKTDPVPFLITGQTHTPAGVEDYPAPSSDVSTASHLNAVVDGETGYSAPGGLEFNWAGDSRDGTGRASARAVIEKAGKVVGEGGLIEKVDVLHEIPYVIRKGLAAATGTKPFIYQYHNPTTLEVTRGEETVSVKGWIFNEASFVNV